MRGTFPLYTEAVKSFGKPEAMIRTAVKTLTLNVYKGFFFEFSFQYFGRYLPTFDQISRGCCNAKVHFGENHSNLFQ